MNGRPWTDDEDETMRLSFPGFPTFLVAHVLDRSMASVNSRATTLGLHKSAKYLASPWACRLRRGDQVGKPYRFPKGNVPANKGLRRPGYVRGRMAETQFRKGEKPVGWLPIGSTRVNADGYLDRKLDDRGRSNLDWMAEHRLVWFAHHGPVPAGHVVAFKPGRRTTVEADITIDAIECISLRDNMKRNSFHNNYPKEIGLAIQARAVLTRTIRKARNG